MARRRYSASLIVALLSSSFILAGASAQPFATQPGSLMSRIRKFLDLQPRSVSVGGTRTGERTEVCVLAPGPIEKVDGVSRVLVVESKPDLVLGTPLNEIQIRSGQAVLWTQLATSRVPIAGRLGWPLPPISPGQQMELGIRPRGSAGGDWAWLKLVGAPQQIMEQTAQVLSISKHSEGLRLKSIDQALQNGDNSVALALIWSETMPPSKSQIDLQEEARRGCP
jgi:hypothetical protein